MGTCHATIRGLATALVLALLAVACGGSPEPSLKSDLLRDSPAVDPGDAVEDPGEPLDAAREVPDAPADATVVVPCQADEDCVTALLPGPCQVARCDLQAGECTLSAAPDGIACEGASACEKDGQCVGGTCSGRPVNCDDGNPCTDDSCEATTGCRHQDNTAPCDDGNACTDGEACSGGACLGGTNHCPCEVPADCDGKDDGDRCNGLLTCVGRFCVIDATTVVHCSPRADDPCRLPVCDPATGLCGTRPANDGSPCDDADFCTRGDVCKDGACAGAEEVPCDDGNPCTDDSCDPLNGCVFTPNTATCDDGNGCTQGDACRDGQCIGTPGTDCGCTKTSDCGSFEDGNQCNGTLRCKGGMCVVDPASIVHCDSSADTVCARNSCDSKTGQCAVEPLGEGRSCDDGDACTLDSECKDGKCLATTPVSCDDRNPCTADSCDPVKGCLWVPAGGACDDGLACTTGDACVAGRCVGQARACDDQEPCTDDGCDPATGACTHVANTAPCDDGSLCTAGDACAGGLCSGLPVDCEDHDPCTLDGCDPGKGCQHLAASPEATCDDGDPCTTGDVCGADGSCRGRPDPCDDAVPCTDDACVPGAGCRHVPDAGLCNDGNACTDDTCNPQTGCQFLPNALPCDDGNRCTVGDACVAGGCQPGAAALCDDGNPCTDDGCDPASGCWHVDNAAPCDDGNACTFADLCAAGSCNPGDAVQCPVPLTPCLTARCLPTQGCIEVPNDGTCEDGDACTLGDTCADGRCVPGTASPLCDDANPCTTDRCDPVMGCVYVALEDGAKCDDGSKCTAGDQCLSGECVGQGVKCPPGPSPCHVFVCTDPDVGCGPAIEPDGTPCDDGDPCTRVDTCLEGACVGKVPVVCNDANACTNDACVGGQCVYVPNSDPCDDGNPCTVSDTCIQGRCAGGAAANCDDGNLCTSDHCDPATGCVNLPNSLPCDDGNECTAGDLCREGVCAGTARSCDDRNPCTADLCDPASGCLHKPVDGTCDDGNPCTVGDTCGQGACVPGTKPLDCDDLDPCTDDRCDPTVPEGCVHEFNQAPCSDGSACTVGDGCVEGKCLPGPAPDCDDRNVCTRDLCDPATGCVHLAVPGLGCDDGSACTSGDACLADGTCGGKTVTCDDLNPCTDDSCDPASGCVFVANAAPCEDGNTCTAGDTCARGQCQPGAPVACKQDSNLCTTETCINGAGCVSIPNGNPCEDGSVCTLGDTCADGTCRSGTGVLDCDDGNPCTLDGCDPALGCRHEALKDGTLCDDQNKCTTGDQCLQGTCVGLGVQCPVSTIPCTQFLCTDPQVGCQLVVSQDGVKCDDKDACSLNDQCVAGVCTPQSWVNCDDGNACTNDLCDRATGVCAHVFNTAPCDDGNACTTGESCNGQGLCGGGSPVTCNDGNPCTENLCDAKAGCYYPWLKNGALCDDGDACTLRESCLDGVCTPMAWMNCDDQNPCTDDSCDPKAGCLHVPTVKGAACDDGSLCTVSDQCDGTGRCLGSAVVCDDLNLCTDDRCDPASGCVYVGNSRPCSDGNLCTSGDTCSGGECVGKPINCWTQDPCLLPGCDPSSGCTFKVSPNACDDGSACTTKDTCNAAGVCEGVAVNPDDKNPCTRDSCDPLTGLIHLPVTGVSCLVPSGTAYVPGTCMEGLCRANTGCSVFNCLVDSSPCTFDYCVGLTCGHTPFAGLACSDGKPCTTADTCAATGGCVGTVVNCDDQNPCTTDFCAVSVAAGCTHAPVGDGTLCAGGACWYGVCLPL